MDKNISEIVYFNGRFTKLSDVRISPLDRGFIFGEGMYTTIACQGGVPLFFEHHEKRLHNQIKEFRFPISLEGLEEICLQLLAKNHLENASLYIHLTRGADQARHHIPQNNEGTMLILATPWEVPVQLQLAQALLVPDLRWGRCDLKVTSLLPNVQASQNAYQLGYEKVIFHRDGMITEAAQANLFIVKSNILITPIANQFLLNGVTRQIVMQEAQNDGLLVLEQDITVDDLYHADEVFLTASLSQLVGITKIHDKMMPTSFELTKRLLSLYEQRKRREFNTGQPQFPLSYKFESYCSS